MTSEAIKPVVIVIMGVAGSGKTTIGELLAAELCWDFADADSFHSAANIQKMSEGMALTDDDRAPWLQSMHEAIALWIVENQPTVLACSALKNKYREDLKIDSQKVRVVYLRASLELLSQRLKQRQGHFMKAKMLESQFLALEEPEPADALAVDADRPPKEIVSEICQVFGLLSI